MLKEIIDKDIEQILIDNGWLKDITRTNIRLYWNASQNKKANLDLKESCPESCIRFYWSTDDNIKTDYIQRNRVMVSIYPNAKLVYDDDNKMLIYDNYIAINLL